MRSKRLNILIGLLIVLSLAVSSLSLVGAQDMKVLNYGRSVGGDLNTIDPSVAEVADEVQVIEQLFVGLTAQNEADGALLPGMA
ncbi:MAG TPA: hypothetical protein VJZ27_06065 [Aggregatilineales bacterium]|nr:hypothetical protein [Aggregatilineales bacterium]